MRSLLFLLASAALSFGAALSGNKITADGTYTVPTIAGQRYVFSCSGTFGSGSLAVNWYNGNSVAYANSPATAAETWTFTAAASTLELVLTGSTNPNITVGVNLAVANAVDNAVLNEAILEDPAASRAALGVTDGSVSTVIIPSNLVSDAKRFSNGVVSGTSLTSSTASFVSGDVGKLIRIEGAGTAGVDLVTTISARVSATQITLADSAPTAIGSGAWFYYGTDNSQEIQAAMDEAYASTTCRKVLIPGGRYLANVKMREYIQVEGISPRITQTSILNLSDATVNAITDATVLMAATADPVIGSEASGFSANPGGYNPSGTKLSRIFIVGSSNRNSYGVRYGIENGSGFHGQCFAIEDMFICGFEYGVSITSCADFTIARCQIASCDVGINLAEPDGDLSGRATDGAEIEACTINPCTIGIRSVSSKNITVSACDIGGSVSEATTNALWIYSSYVAIVSLNVERISGDVVRKFSGGLKIDSFRGADCAAALVAEHDTSTTRQAIEIGTISFSTTLTWGATSARAVIVRHAVQGFALQKHLPADSIVLRYTDTTWATIMNAERTNDVFGAALQDAIYPPMNEFFPKTAATPYGSLGWVMTGVSGSYVVSSDNGRMRLASSNNTSTNVGRFSLDAETLYAQNQAESRFIFLDANATSWNTKWRVGLYSRTALFLPVSGIGVRYDPTPISAGSFVSGVSYVIRSAGSTDFTAIGSANNSVGTAFIATGAGTGTGTAGRANLWFEVVSSSTPTEVETSIRGNTLTAARQFIISRSAQGNYLTILDANGVPLGQWNNTATPPAAFVSPAVFTGATTAQDQDVRVESFRYQRLF